MFFLTLLLSLIDGTYLKKIVSFFKTCELNHKSLTILTTEAEFIFIYFISTYIYISRRS